ncbi:MAG: BamA/TamA family outer membrane protein [Chitinispirillia bacterium]|nr:BamA/TamA family outer membrane protein [Chitinispirillia bacterium]MCL2241852.1 BamA/TamA family outer membrane protein [Chitinispirillia bacterium]
MIKSTRILITCTAIALCLPSAYAQGWFHPERVQEEQETLREPRQAGPEGEEHAEQIEPPEPPVPDSAASGQPTQRFGRSQSNRDGRAAREEQRERQRRIWHVQSIAFNGNESYKSRDLLSLMELRPKSWPNGPARFTYFLMNSDLGVLRAFYRNLGFESVEVKTERIVRDSTSRHVSLHINIKEGPRTHVSDVTVLSDKYELKPVELRRLATRPGVPLIHQDVRQDARKIKELLGERGFLAASVDPSLDFDTANTLASVTFNVTEGPKAVACKVELEGNKGIAGAVLKRELAFRSGDTLSLRTIRQSERRLYTTGLFNYVQVSPGFDTTRKAAELPDSAYNVRVRVSPTEFFSLQGGVGYSSDEGPRVSGSATYRNMFRLGQGMTLAGKVSPILQSAEAVYVIPWFLYMPLQFDTKVYYNRYDNAELYRGEFEGIRVSLGRQTDYNFLYQIWSQWEEVRWIRAPQTDDDGPIGIPKYPTQSIGWDVSYDMRNDLFNPTKGGYTHLGVEVAGVFGGKSNQFLKVTLDNRVYFSRQSKYFLSMALRTGYAMPYGESEVVPVQSQFYGGGSTTVRGFPVNKLAVIPGGNDPLTGNFYVFANLADFRFPLYWWFNGAVFLDAGNVWSDFSDVKSLQGLADGIRWSIGPGLRVDTPIKLVARLDMGFKIDKRPGESAWELHFDLGQPF